MNSRKNRAKEHSVCSGHISELMSPKARQTMPVPNDGAWDLLSLDNSLKHSEH